MNSRHILTALATAGLIVGGPALAQGRGGGHGGGHGQSMGGGHGQSMGGGVRGGANVRTDLRGADRIETGTRVGVRSRARGRVNSRGPAHAADRALERSNENSVLQDDSLVPPDLSGLRTGLEVRSANGVRIGTIARINRAGDGSVRNVLVRDVDGTTRILPVDPGTLSIDGDIVTTTRVRLRDD